MVFIRQVIESFIFAWQALKSNILRTTLSLLGVTVGIFAIVAVFTIVDSLEKNVKESLKEIGDRVVYVQKWPWGFGGEYAWWKYFRWPEPNYNEFRFLADKLENAEAVAVLDARGSIDFKHGSNNGKGSVWGITQDYNKISEIEIESGRYFTPLETNTSKNVTIIGAKVADWLFPGQDPLGQVIKIAGNKFTVIGLQKRKGSSMLEFNGKADEKCYIPYGAFAKYFSSGRMNVDIAVKGFERDHGLQELEAEITGLMRSKRALKPRDENNFSINRPDAAAKAIDGMFAVLTLAGWIIGSFSILVGGFGIANIMFVSVRERTNLIGIQKSLGAKNYFILLQFLFEAIMLSLVGGLVGVLLVYLITLIPLGEFQLVMKAGNIILGLGVSSLIGMLSGLIPAMMASRMDPVVAIRAK
ncbi:ABC transporter permease [Ravibacter arvi]|uniref:ABC transporter permease n=1 Tax=Ravibacter arvi TaxID=2051041 RepID=A0ABP8M9T3_9BACT